MDALKAILSHVVRRLLVVALVSLLSVAGIFSLTATASYAQIPLNSQDTGLTKEELTGKPKDAPLSAEEKIERAYTFGEGAGMREEEKLNYEDLAEEARNPRVLKKPQAEEGLLDKAKELIENVTGH
jgi:precorrin-2 methylase